MAVAVAPDATGPSAADVSTFLLDLHERSNELGYRELQEHALRQFSQMIPFESGLLAMGTIQDGVPHGHDVVLHGCSPELMASWETIKHQDRVALWAFGHPGETGNFAVDGPIFDGLEEARAHCRRFRLAHVLCTSMISRDTGLYWVMSTYRSDPARPFLESERKATELLVPHVFSASRRARLMQLRTRANVHEAEGEPSAIANEGGLVLEAEPAFAEMLRLGFPRWAGPVLPREVSSELRPDAARRVAHGKVVLRIAPANGVYLVRARRLHAADALTAREREIAEAFSLGETHKELAARFELSPNTVRRHLANIYEKLGISSKAELDRMLR
jgi:DNA-binding CsgD family transcriptional regulator